MLDKLIEDACEALKNAGHSEKTIYSKFRYRWMHLLQMFPNDTIFNENVCSTYFIKRYGRDLFLLKHDESTVNERNVITVFKTLLQFHKTGIVHTNELLLKPTISGKEKELLNEYLKHSENECNSERTQKNKKNYIVKFLSRVNIYDFNLEELKKYLNSFEGKSKIGSAIEINVVKRFIEYSIKNKKINVDFFKYFPNRKLLRNSKLPSVYSKDEILLLVNYAKNNFKNVNYHRNYCIILLLVFYGIRAKDIAEMKLNQIDWKNNYISIIHSKTKTHVKYPLIPLLGNSIIDYIRYERKNANDEHLFLTEKGFKFTDSKTVTFIVTSLFRNSPVKINGRHFGPHAIRHSLASILINDGTPIFNIANILGHSSVTSTSIYAKVNITQLFKCPLEVDVYE